MKFGLDTIFNLKPLIKELATGLSRLDFINNFESFETAELTIAATTEEKIRNELSAIPTKMIITKQTGNSLVTAGDTAWSDDFVYIRNQGSNSVTVKVLFLK